MSIATFMSCIPVKLDPLAYTKSKSNSHGFQLLEGGVDL